LIFATLPRAKAAPMPLPLLLLPPIVAIRFTRVRHERHAMLPSHA